MSDVTVKLLPIQLNFEQNIEYNNYRIARKKTGEKNSKIGLWYCGMCSES